MVTKMTDRRLGVLLLVSVVLVCYCRRVDVSAATLYQRNGPVVQLWTNNFTTVVHQSTKLWIVNFYVSWCGHCQRFSRPYEQFARDVEAWQPVVGVAAVVCSEMVNNALCRTFGGTSYPAVKLYPPNAPPSDLGQNVPGDQTIATLPLVVLQYLDDLIARRSTDPSWPQLDFVRRPGELSSNFTGTVYIVVEDSDAIARHVGKMVILDLLNWQTSVRVGRMSLIEAEPLGVTSRGLYGLTSFNQLYPIGVEFGRRSIVNEIQRRMSATPAPSYSMSTSSVSWLASGMSTRTMSGFHMQDLESSLYYSLWSEVPSRPVIEGEALEALKRHIDVMYKYLPAESHIVNFLLQTSNWLKSQTESVLSSDWLNYITKSQNADAYVPSRLLWSGCHGSQPQYRGYPCSLWMTFHSLTVNAYLREANNSAYTADEVITSIRGYVEHFLTCRDCAEHFARAANELLTVSTAEPFHLRRDGAIIWLWLAHNRANSRLHNDVTEDPMFPKVQFPSPELCPYCRLDDVTMTSRANSGSIAWNESAVLDFLQQFYGARNVVDDDVHDAFSGSSNAATDITWPSSASLRPTTTQGYQVTVQGQSSRSQGRSQTCQTVNTKWTPCSKTCNVGMSMRITNNNDQCKPEVQVRLCLVRPCELGFPNWNQTARERSQCRRDGHTYHLREPQRLRFGDCSTVEAVSWRVCGRCPPTVGSSRPVCCRPARSSTRAYDVNCTVTSSSSSSRGSTARPATARRQQLTTKMLIEVIEYCQCDEQCSPEELI